MSKEYRLSKHPLMGDYEDLINHATDLMPVIEMFLRAELNKVEAKLDSEELFELPAYKERIGDLIAQRRLLKKLMHYFQGVDHA